MNNIEHKLNEIDRYISTSKVLTFKYDIINDNNIIAKCSINIKDEYNKFIDINSTFTLSNDLIYFINKLFFYYDVKYNKSNFTIYKVVDNNG